MDSKIAVVTGAGTGIGKASAIALAKVGFRIALLGRRAEKLEAVQREITTDGGFAIAVPTDVGIESEVVGAFCQVVSRFGRVDLLFNNAGSSLRAIPIDELRLDQWQRIVDVNLTGSFLCAREAFRVMKSQSPRGGRIINNGSISAHVPRLYSAAYTATKHAVTGLTKSLSLEGREFDIACGQIDIGNAQSDMTQNMAEGMLQANGKKLVEPVFDVTHVANAVVYMATLPLDANVQFMTVMATKMPFVGRG